MLHEVLPKAGTIALIYNPNNPNHTLEVRSLEAAARVRKLRLHPLEASNDSDIELASRKLKTQRPDALLVMTDPFLNSRVNNFVALSTSHNLPTIYGFREFVVAGGLMSYGTSNLDARRQAGLLVARILQGEKPSDLPVWQSIKIELVLNLKIAKELGLTMPITLLGRADEVIE
jgi:putative ABC transport system substrate-binding protein